ncbi:hypothetical protein BTUL_0049g00370 [Botrytis tulipae]|uniref:Uncharacterized protein n=1 Tax=Botrytis tulipae TaxID=87230 RepID=A0A4Z1EUS4_9HELO|nr:hypothetical protein BTUL_0049g00370 [Botrytis tulipae]
MSNTSKCSNIAVQGSVRPLSSNNTSDHLSNATSSTEAGHLSIHRIQCYLANNEAPVPYALPALPTDGNHDGSSTAVHAMSGKLQQFDAIYYGRREV